MDEMIVSAKKIEFLIEALPVAATEEEQVNTSQVLSLLYGLSIIVALRLADWKRYKPKSTKRTRITDRRWRERVSTLGFSP